MYTVQKTKAGRFAVVNEWDVVMSIHLTADKAEAAIVGYLAFDLGRAAKVNSRSYLAFRTGFTGARS